MISFSYNRLRTTEGALLLFWFRKNLAFDLTTDENRQIDTFVLLILNLPHQRGNTIGTRHRNGAQQQCGRERGEH